MSGTTEMNEKDVKKVAVTLVANPIDDQTILNDVKKKLIGKENIKELNVACYDKHHMKLYADGDLKKYDGMVKGFITKSDYILVLNENGRVDSTVNDVIEFANMHNIPVKYLLDSPDRLGFYVYIIGAGRFNGIIKQLYKELNELRPDDYLLHIAKPVMSHMQDVYGESIFKEDTIHLLEDEVIQKSDIILCVNHQGYIGDDTKRELMYAIKLGKPIVFYNEIMHDGRYIKIYVPNDNNGLSWESIYNASTIAKYLNVMKYIRTVCKNVYRDYVQTYISYGD